MLALPTSCRGRRRTWQSCSFTLKAKRKAAVETRKRRHNAIRDRVREAIHRKSKASAVHAASSTAVAQRGADPPPAAAVASGSAASTALQPAAITYIARVAAHRGARRLPAVLAGA